MLLESKVLRKQDASAKSAFSRVHTMMLRADGAQQSSIFQEEYEPGLLLIKVCPADTVMQVSAHADH